VIRAEVEARGPVLVADLPAGSVAYIDRDWLPPASGEVPALIAAADGAFAWRGGPAVQMEAGLDSDTAAALAFLTVSRTAVTAVEDAAKDSIEVTGSGLIARQVRELLGHSSSSSGQSARFERPTAVVDTTGDAAVIVDATRRLENLGVLVLVGESHGCGVELNLYPDVHVRGLTLVGMPPPLQGAHFHAVTEAGDPLVEASRRLLVAASSGGSLPPEAAWYRVSG
jgi:hypothetical protein